MSQTAEPASPEEASAATADLPEPRAAETLHDPDLAALRSDALLEELVRRLRLLLDADSATVLTVDPEAQIVRPIVSQGIPLSELRDLVVPLGAGFAGRIAATAAPLRIDDVADLPDLVGTAFRAAGVRSLLGVPLVIEGQVVGVIHVGSRVTARFGDDDERLLMAAADRAAWAIDHGLLRAAQEAAQHTATSAAERLHRLRVIAEELLTGLTVESVVTTVVERGLSLVGAFAGAMWQLDDAGTLRLRGCVGYPPEVVERWRELPLRAEGPTSEAARTRRRIVVRSLSERDARYPSLRGRGDAGEAFVAAPLVVEGALLGVLGLGFARADDLDEDSVAFIDAATAQCAAAMHRAFIVEEQQHSLVQARETARRLGALQRVTAALADARDSAATLEFIVRELTDATGAEQLALNLLDEAAGVMRTTLYHGAQPDIEHEFREFPFLPGLPATDALLRRQPVVLRDREERDALYPVLAKHRQTQHAWICLPLVIGDHGLGTLSLSFPAQHGFAPEDLEFLSALADQCGHALERARLLESETATRDRLELLAEAGRIFSAPLDVRLTSLQFCRLVVGRIGDAVSVHLRESDGSYSLAAAEHVDPEQAVLQREISGQLTAPITSAYDALLASGEAALVPDISLDQALASVDDAQLRERLAACAPRSSIMLPLIAGGHALGVLVVTTVVGGRPALVEGDREQLEELAGRLALAIDGARLLRQQTEIAHTLQRSLLPSVLPRVPGAEVAVRYLPGAEGVDVGGDFYDVIPLASGRIGLVVGDVMGRGVRAAAVMGQLRAAVRSYSLEGHPPAALLTRLDRLVGTLEEGLLVTALYAEWDPGTGTVLCSCAGHLPPLLRLPGAEPAYLEIDPGVPLGVGVQSYQELEISLPPGSLLLAYTDGLVEGPELPVETGMQRLAAAVRDAPTAMDVCVAALADLRPVAATRRYDDDTALLALLTHDGDSAPRATVDDANSRSTDLPADYESPAHARALVVDALEQWQLSSLSDAAALLVSELVTNGVRHAGTGMRVTVSRIGEGRVRVAVTDHAPGVDVQLRRSDSEAEGGRGLFLVEHLSAGWGSAVDGDGKTVWFELQG